MLCKKCGNEYPEGASVCPSCNTSLEQSDKEKQGVFPMGIGRMGFWAAATAYGITSASVVGKDKRISNVVSAAETANKAVTASSLAGATAYGIPSATAGSIVGAAVSIGVQAIPCPEGAARTLYGMPPISSRNFGDRDYEIVRDKKLCNYCNAKIKLDDKVCPRCGKKLGFVVLSEIEDKYK